MFSNLEAVMPGFDPGAQLQPMDWITASSPAVTVVGALSPCIYIRVFLPLPRENGRQTLH